MTTYVGAKIKAEDFPATVWAADDTSNLNITSTSYVSGTPVVSVTFIAPTSGRVLLTVGAGMRDSSGINRVHVAPLVRLTNAGGAQVLAPDVTTRGVGCPAEAVNYAYYSRTTLLEGLTPGQQYYAHVVHKVSGGNSGDISAREIMVEPTS